MSGIKLGKGFYFNEDELVEITSDNIVRRLNQPTICIDEVWLEKFVMNLIDARLAKK